MKIADLGATPVNIPLRAPYRFAHGSIASLTKTVVEVVTDEGVVGLGEIAGEPSQTLFRWYADDVIAEGPFVPKGGLVAVPTGPGLGVTLDPVALARCHERYRTEGSFPGGPGKGGYGEAFRRR